MILKQVRSGRGLYGGKPSIPMINQKVGPLNIFHTDLFGSDRERIHAGEVMKKAHFKRNQTILGKKMKAFL